MIRMTRVAGRAGQRLGAFGVVVLMASAAWGACVAAETAAAADDQVLQPAHGVIDVTVRSIAVIALDRNGAAVLDLRPDELQVSEDGGPVKVLELAHGTSPRAATDDDGEVAPEPAAAAVEARPWRVVAYVSTELAGRFVLPQLCRAMANEADNLAALGPVDVVLADPAPEFIIRRSRGLSDIQQALETVADRASGMTTVEQIRRSFTADFKPGVGFNQQYTITQSSPTSFAARARSSVNRERTVIRGELDRLVAWIQDQPPTERGVLVWLTGGFDLNPADFYLPLLEQIDPFLAQSLRSDYSTLSLESDVSTLVEVALSYGWVVLPVSLSTATFAYGADIAGTGKTQHHFGVGVNSIEAQGFDFQQVAPNYPLQVLAAATGGELVVSHDQLRAALGSTGTAYQLAYQVDRPADGLLHKVEIATTRPGVRILSRSFVASGSLRGVATARAERRLAGDEVDGGLVMGAAIGNITRAEHGDRIGDLQVRAAIGQLRGVLEPLALGRVRISVVVESGNDAPFVHHQEVTIDWDSLHDGVWYFNVGLKWPRRADRMAVVAEELVSGSWGATVLDLRSADKGP